MRILPSFLLLALAASLLIHVDAQCTAVVERREWRQLSRDEQARFIKAIRQLQTDGSPSTYDRLVNVHLQKAGEIHGTANFLPWHRLYLYVLEFLLRRIDPSVFVPYWDWGFDSQGPEDAPVFDDDPEIGFGRNGDLQDRCIKTGAFATWQPQYPFPHCLKRQWAETNRIEVFSSTDFIQIIISMSKNYLSFAPSLEQIPHGQVHNAIGGLAGDLTTMASPNDPLFFLHHANLDRYWAMWQASDPAYVRDYAGVNFDGTPASASDALVGFKAKQKSGVVGPIKVGQVLDMSKLCYKYIDMPIDVVKASLPPSAFDSGAAKSLVRRLWRRNGGGIDPSQLVSVVNGPPLDAPHYCARMNINLLAPPQELPSAWIRTNRLRVEDVRANEQRHRNLIIAANRLPDYSSVSCLWNQPLKLMKIINQIGTFVVYTQGKVVSVTLPTVSDPAQGVADLMALVRHAVGPVQKNPSEIADQVRQILGDRVPGISPIMDGWRDRH